MSTPDPFAQFKDAPADPFAHFQNAPPEMSRARGALETGIGAAQELGHQAVGGAQAVASAGMLPGTIAKPPDMGALKQEGHAVVEAAKHPIDTAETALAAWKEKLAPHGGVQTPEQARARGAAGVQGLEAVLPAVGAVGDIARLGGAAGARALAPLAEKVAARGEAKTAEAAAASQTKNDLIRDVRKLGLRLTSQDVGAPIGKRVEAMASRPQLEREISLGNAARVKEAAAADVGIKGPLSKGAVNEAITESLVPYKAPRALGRVNLAQDAKWQADIKAIGETSSQEALDYPEDVIPRIDQEVAKFNRPDVDADSMVSKIAKLRERASDNFAGNADDKALARAQRKLATSMQAPTERHGIAAGKTGVIDAFRAARTRLAKLYTIRDALTETGELDLGVLEKELAKGEPLTGNLRTLARAKASFDRSFQNPENIRGHPIGAGDIALGVLAGGGKGAVAGGPGGALAGGLAVAARPTTRVVLGSGAYQKAFIKPRVPKAGLVTREARKIADAGKPQTLESVKKKPKPKRKAPTLEEERAQAGQ